MAANTAAVYSNEPEPRAERTLKNACLGMLKNACLEDSAVGGGVTLRVVFLLDTSRHVFSRRTFFFFNDWR
jgi:hypothetical protein